MLHIPVSTGFVPQCEALWLEGFFGNPKKCFSCVSVGSNALQRLCTKQPSRCNNVECFCGAWICSWMTARKRHFVSELVLAAESLKGPRCTRWKKLRFAILIFDFADRRTEMFPRLSPSVALQIASPLWLYAYKGLRSGMLQLLVILSFNLDRGKIKMGSLEWNSLPNQIKLR